MQDSSVSNPALYVQLRLCLTVTCHSGKAGSKVLLGCLTVPNIMFLRLYNLGQRLQRIALLPRNEPPLSWLKNAKKAHK